MGLLKLKIIRYWFVFPVEKILPVFSSITFSINYFIESHLGLRLHPRVLIANIGFKTSHPLVEFLSLQRIKKKRTNLRGAYLSPLCSAKVLVNLSAFNFPLFPTHIISMYQRSWDFCSLKSFSLNKAAKIPHFDLPSYRSASFRVLILKQSSKLNFDTFVSFWPLGFSAFLKLKVAFLLSCTSRIINWPTVLQSLGN